MDDGTIIGDKAEVFKVFELLAKEGPEVGLHLKKNEIWWPSRSGPDPFPEVERVDNSGVKLLGGPIGTEEFTAKFVSKKLDVLQSVCEA